MSEKIRGWTFEHWTRPSGDGTQPVWTEPTPSGAGRQIAAQAAFGHCDKCGYDGWCAVVGTSLVHNRERSHLECTHSAILTSTKEPPC